ncbi:MAG: DegT/DnrJ/EryC1/StrS aminotransferase family protein [Termitinemataceae bacterium]
MNNTQPSPIPFALPFIGKEEEEAVLRVLRSGWLTTGTETLQFEKEFAEFFGEPIHALAVNSATSGLHLALEACGVGPGDVVLTSPYTFTATAEVVRYLGAHVAFVDVVPGTYLMDPQKLETTLERLSSGLPAYPHRCNDHCNNIIDGRVSNDAASEGFGPRGKPTVVIPVHIAGLSCDMDAITRLATKYNVRIVEDAAHAFPSRRTDGRWVGLIGDIGVFSFYATKTITTGEGGMVVTGDEALAKRISIMRSHGIDRSIWNRYRDTKASWRYAVVAPGYKYNLSDVLAAIGRVQLQRALDLLAMRKAIAEQYNQAFSESKALMIPPNSFENAWHLYPLRLAGPQGPQRRDAFIEALQQAGIGVSVHFIPLHTMPYYAQLYGLDDHDFPYALDSFSRSISLPIWPGMTDLHVKRVIETVLKTVKDLEL